MRYIHGILGKYGISWVDGECVRSSLIFGLNVQDHNGYWGKFAVLSWIIWASTKLNMNMLTEGGKGGRQAWWSGVMEVEVG